MVENDRIAAGTERNEVSYKQIIIMNNKGGRIFFNAYSYEAGSFLKFLIIYIFLLKFYS